MNPAGFLPLASVPENLFLCESIFFKSNFTVNRFQLSLLALFACARAGFGQDYGLCNQVLSAGGDITIQQGNTWAWTVGEPVIFTLGPVSNHVLAQGFHQPDLCLPVSTQEATLADWQIEVFPNPTSDFLHLRFSAEKTGALRASVFDLLGRTVLFNVPLDSPDGSLLDCSGWLPGVYLLHLQDVDSRAATTLRIIRL